MPKLGLFNIEAKQVGEIQLNDNIFAAEVNADAMHQVVVALLANKRQGTSSSKEAIRTERRRFIIFPLNS